MEKIYAQYGCGSSCPKEWLNFDSSPSLILQNLPIIGFLIRPRLNYVFADNVKFGNIIKGLPLSDETCDGIYCSHTLEHLSLTDCRIAIKNSFKLLKKGGIFRCIVPDLEASARIYINEIDNKNSNGSIQFMNETLLGVQNRPKSFKAIVSNIFGNANHLWMWDHISLKKELLDAGFKEVRICNFNDSKDDMFKYVESEGRFIKAVALEAIKEI